MPPDEAFIREMLERYFQGLHQGDAGLLKPLFHSDCVLKAPGLRRSRDTWLADVLTRPVPAAQGHPWRYQVIWLEVLGEQAMAKVNCPLPHGHFMDYLGFLKEAGEWRIVNKMYAERV
ncbi:MAG: nuclear transport factor 2 family protein [Ketobacter sp.]|nr:MAG: nuclear transport factor 2 family protein [Ketobacter sp.]